MVIQYMVDDVLYLLDNMILMYFPRWTEVAKQLGIKFENLIGDVLVSSAVVAYLGAFTAAFRQVLYTFFCCKMFSRFKKF